MTAPLRQNGPSPEELWEMDRAHSLHPWTNFGPFEKEGSLLIERGEGCYLWDGAGRRYFDAVGGMWCTNIGLGRAEMGQAIADQAVKLGFANSFVDVTNGPSALLAAKLAALAPGDLNRVHFTTGGSTAVDTAYRMVHFYQSCRGQPQKTQVIARNHSYHGSTYISQSIGKRPGDRVAEFRYKESGIHHISAPNFYRAPEGMSEAAFTDHLIAEFEAKLAEVGPENVGGFFAEPIQASGGDRLWPPGPLVREPRSLWVPTRYHHLRQRVNIGLYPLGRADLFGSDLGCDGRRRRSLVHLWLHLFGASRVLRRRSQEYRDHGAGGPVGQRHPHRRAVPVPAGGLARFAHGGRCARRGPDDLRGKRC